MSLKSIFTDLLNLFYPKLCLICENQLVSSENMVCLICKNDLPKTQYIDDFNNKITASFYGKVVIEKAVALLIFRKNGKTKELIHALKYKNNQEIGIFLGQWFGSILKEKDTFSTVDVIIPVPLHPKKLKKRGYNQLTKFGICLSDILKIPFEENQLIKTETTKTQTFKTRFDRFDDKKTVFQLKDKDIFTNKHILLIDDVITTGATIENCAKELQKTKGIKISVLAMAFTE